MNFYPFHIGDYAAHTKHLSLYEDLAYRRLLDLYYTSEKPLPSDPVKVARLIGMREQVREVSDVLSDFFLITEEGHINKRCDDEILKYRGKAERAVKANKSRWNSDKPMKSDIESDAKSDTKSDAVLIPTNNQEPITNNQKKETTKRKSSQPEKPADVSESVWSDFNDIRKAKRSPLTKTALAGIAAEAEKAGITLQNALEQCCARGWQGFKASWAIETNQARSTSTPNRQEALEARNQAVAEEFARNLQ